MATHRLARVQLFAAAALFSTGGAAIKLSALSPLWIAGLRSLVAALFLVALERRVRVAWGGRTWLVALAYTATMVLFVAANRLTTAANTAFLQGSAPLYILFLGPWLLRERMRRTDPAFMLALAIGMAFVFVGRGDVQATAPRPALGNVLGVGAGLAWGATVLGLRWVGAGRADRDPGEGGSARGPGSATLGVVLLGNALTAALTLPLAWGTEAPPVWGARDVGVLLWLGLFQVGLAYVLLGRGVRHVRAFEASLLLALEPALTPLWAFLVHGERVAPWAAAGGGVILATTVCMALRRDVPVPGDPPRVRQGVRESPGHPPQSGSNRSP